MPTTSGDVATITTVALVSRQGEFMPRSLVQYRRGENVRTTLLISDLHVALQMLLILPPQHPVLVESTRDRGRIQSFTEDHLPPMPPIARDNHAAVMPPGRLGPFPTRRS